MTVGAVAAWLGCLKRSLHYFNIGRLLVRCGEEPASDSDNIELAAAWIDFRLGQTETTVAATATEAKTVEESPYVLNLAVALRITAATRI